MNRVRAPMMGHCPGCDNANDSGWWVEVETPSGTDLRCEACVDETCVDCGTWCGEGVCKYDRVCVDCHECGDCDVEDQWYAMNGGKPGEERI